MIAFLIIAVIVIIYLVFQLRESESEQTRLRENINFNNSTFEKKKAELKLEYQDWAIAQFNKFKEKELEQLQITFQKQSIETAKILLQKWKIENEAMIRQDAINRSYSVNLGKITEHLVPFHKTFPFNPKYARFIGSPIDMIVFDGHSEKQDEITIWIVEVKTGNSRLTEGQQKIKTAVKNAQIRWFEINPDDENTSITLPPNLKLEFPESSETDTN